MSAQQSTLDRMMERDNLKFQNPLSQGQKLRRMLDRMQLPRSIGVGPERPVSEGPMTRSRLKLIALETFQSYVMEPIEFFDIAPDPIYSGSITRSRAAAIKCSETSILPEVKQTDNSVSENEDTFLNQLMDQAPYRIAGLLGLKIRAEQMYETLYNGGLLKLNAPHPNTFKNDVSYPPGMNNCWDPIPQEYNFRPCDRYPERYPLQQNSAQ